MTKKPNKRLNHIDVTRIQNGKLYVLGRNERPCSFDLFKPRGNLYEIIHDAATGEIISEYSFKYHDPKALDEAKGCSFLLVGIPFLLNELRPSLRKRREQSKKYFETVVVIERANMADYEAAVKDIRVYQGSIDEVAKELGKELERVDTGKPETYLRERNSFWLRVKANYLGADAIVHSQPGSSMGTPVKFKGGSE